MKVKLTAPQTKFFQSTARNTAAVAGFGSGKTQVTMFRMFSTMIQFPKANMLYTAPTFPLIRDILWAKIEDFLPGLGLKYTINKAEGIVYVHGHGKIFCRSMDAPERIVGLEVLDAFADELDIMSTEKALLVIRKIKARMRQKVKLNKRDRKRKHKKNQLYVSTTPEGYKATYELFKKDPLPDSNLIQMSTYSNPYLPDGYIDDLKESYPKQLIEAYLNGEFVNLTNAPVWAEYRPELHDINTKDHKFIAPTPEKPLHIGMDFNVNRGCAVVYQRYMLPVGHPNNPTTQPLQILVSVDEVIDTQDTPETLEVLAERYPKDVYPKRIVYPDASGKSRKSVNATISDLTLVADAGFTIKKPNKNPPIKDRVAATNAAFLNSKNVTKLYIQRRATPVLSDAFIKQAYTNNGLPEKGFQKGDDVTDAATYPINYMFPIKRQRIFATTLGGT